MVSHLTESPLLTVDNLSVGFRNRDGVAPAVKGVSFKIDAGETVALVGESGSGKSVSSLAMLQLLPDTAVVDGSARFRGRELLTADKRTMREIRGNDISMIFQEPMTALNPLHTVEKQIGESLTLHRGLKGAAALEKTLELLEQVRIRDPKSKLDSYPHQLSGGQRQRVMIAMALANNPDLLIADEPTTALDVTVQAEILTLLRELQDETGMGMLFITHDLGVVQRMADHVCVMQQGEIVEQGPTMQVFRYAEHPYTQRLLAAEPSGAPEPIPENAPEVARADDIKVWFPIKRGLLGRTVGHVKAVDGVSFSIRAGETLGVVGESGSGKTTLGLAVLRLIHSEGRIVFLGDDLRSVGARALRNLRRDMQIVFQDPYGALSPRLTVGQIIAEGLEVHGVQGDGRDMRTVIGDALIEVGLSPEVMDRYPHEFSGGQRQRIAIARALVLKPKLIVMDEPTSALDMSVQAQIVELLRDLQARHGVAYIFVSHDLKVVRAVSHRIMVMREGRMIESGPAEQIVNAPQTEYARTLMAAAFRLEDAPIAPAD